MRELAGAQVSVPPAPGQSAFPLHHRPLSAHIFAGCPSVQKSPGSAEPQELSLAEAHVVLAVTTPCLHEPHGVPATPTQVSFRRRPDPSVVEMVRQKSPLMALAHVESVAQYRPLVASQYPVVVGDAATQLRGSVAALDPQA
jgi:hypothetical protein